ncbi:MAG: SMI1/KNR4 family protein [Flavobacteriales bacterium]
MPFPVEEIYITETESELNVKFPSQYKNRMKKYNGGELVTEYFEFELYPFFDKSDKKRISRTCNHIGLETKNARKWNGFPIHAIAIASDGCGNHLVLIHNGDGNLTESVHFWDHETKNYNKIADSIIDLED